MRAGKMGRGEENAQVEEKKEKERERERGCVCMCEGGKPLL